MSDPLRPLEAIREDIDALDAQLVKLLNDRAALAQEVGRTKGLDGAPFFTPERERAIFARIREMNPGPLSAKQIQAVFREIISAARAAEQPLKIGFWGPEGTFTHSAALQTFGASVLFQPFESISEVFTGVEHGDVNYGVVPVENAVAGVVPETLDMFPQTNVRICSETYVPISHHLVSNAKELGLVKRVYAGPQPSTQCRRWLRMNLPNVEIVDTAPTARAAQRASEDPEGAAIVNRLCAELMDLPFLAEHIEDNPANRTRFLVIGYNEPAKTGRDKTSVMFSLRNRPGELYRALGAFVENEVNLLMIESRPAQRATFEYIFYIDCEGHHSDASFAESMAKLKEVALETTLLGSYPASPQPG